MPGEYIYPFEIVAPPGPRTYKGHVFDVTWHLGTKVRSSQGEDITVEAEITLLPEKRMSSRGDESTGSKEVVYSQSAKSLMGCFSFSVILTFVGIYVAWRAFFAEKEDMDLFFFGGIVPMLLGFVALFFVTYQALLNRRIKKGEVRLSSRRASPGEEIFFSITFEANIPFKVEKVSATLRANEIVDFFHSNNKKYLRHPLYENRQELLLAVKQVPTKVPIRVEGEVLIPEGVPCSIDLMESGTGMALTWEIEFVIEMKKWPDWIHFEDITVEP